MQTILFSLCWPTTIHRSAAACVRPMCTYTYTYLAVCCLNSSNYSIFVFRIGFGMSPCSCVTLDLFNLFALDDGVMWSCVKIKSSMLHTIVHTIHFVIQSCHIHALSDIIKKSLHYFVTWTRYNPICFVLFSLVGVSMFWLIKNSIQFNLNKKTAKKIER